MEGRGGWPKKLANPIRFQHFRFNKWMEGRGGWQKLNSIGVYVYIWASVYIGLCLCVHICILIAGFFIIFICEIIFTCEIFFLLYLHTRSLVFFSNYQTLADFEVAGTTCRCTLVRRIVLRGSGRNNSTNSHELYPAKLHIHD